MGNNHHLTNNEINELLDIEWGYFPSSKLSENTRVSLKTKGFIIRDDKYPWKWHLTTLGASKLQSLKYK